MNPALRHQLRSLDRALLALLDERARLLCAVEASDPGRNAAIDDMLRRRDSAQGTSFPPAGVDEVFRAVDRHCAEFGRDLAEPSR